MLHPVYRILLELSPQHKRPLFEQTSQHDLLKSPRHRLCLCWHLARSVTVRLVTDHHNDRDEDDGDVTAHQLTRSVRDYHVMHGKSRIRPLNTTTLTTLGLINLR